MRALFFAVLTALGVLAASPARADPIDYVSYLDGNGVAYRTPSAVIAVGRENVCHPLRSGAGIDSVLGSLVDGGFSGDETAYLIIGAIRYLCPDQMPVLEDWRARHNAMI